MYFITYLILVLAVSLMSLTKRIGFTESLFIGLFLTPIVALIIVLKAKDNIQTHHYTMTHTCTVCGNSGIQEENECSSCGHEVEVVFNESKLTIA
jgi:rRNA maturation protein Nop10